METTTHTRFFSALDLLDRAEEGGQRAVRDLDLVADVVGHDDLAALHAEGQDLILRQGDGVGGAADKAGHAADIADQMPGVVRHDHLDQHIAGEGLALDLLAPRRIP